ncbi:unnamed protein product [Cunninghamella blakesleeana]
MPPHQPPSVRNEFLNWYNGLPPVTKNLLSLTIVFTVLPACQLIQYSSLDLNWPFVTHKFQIWRLFTNFFTGSISIPFVFNLYFLYTYSHKLELEVYQGQTADYIYFILISCTGQLFLDRFYRNLRILSGGLIPSIMYLWSKHYADQEVVFMFGFRFKAIFLPWVMVGYEYIASGGHVPFPTIYGIAASHLYYYFKYIRPSQGGGHYLNTPRFLTRLFPPTTGARRIPGVGYAFGSGQRQMYQQQQQQPQSRTNIMGGHVWGRGNRLGGS